MERLFYSEKQGIAFYIPNYYMDNTTNVSSFIKLLEEERLNFAKAIGKSRLDDINSDYITQSSNYKYMRYFWCTMPECPEGAFSIGFKPIPGEENVSQTTRDGEIKHQWTMMDWITK